MYGHDAGYDGYSYACMILRKNLNSPEGSLAFASNFPSPFNETVRVIKQLCHNEFCPGIHFLFEDADGIVFVSVVFWVSFRVGYISDELALFPPLLQH